MDRAETDLVYTALFDERYRKPVLGQLQILLTTRFFAAVLSQLSKLLQLVAVKDFFGQLLAFFSLNPT